MKYYEVSVAKTGKAISSREPRGGGYSCFATERKEFGTVAEVKAYLKENYGTCKREKMYQDKKDGSTIVSGHVYSFKNGDISHPWNDDGSKNEWYQQDWVEVREIESTRVIVK